jgi:hypothetical protein
VKQPIDPSDHELLRRRLEHYRPSYTAAQLRQRLIEDGFDPADVEAALLTVPAPMSADVYGAGVPGPSATPLAAAFVISACTAFAVTLGNGLLPWALIFVGGPFALWLPFAGHSVAVSVELYAYVQTRYDLPNVSRGIGIGMVLGVGVFLAALILVVEWLGGRR